MTDALRDLRCRERNARCIEMRTFEDQQVSHPFDIGVGFFFFFTLWGLGDGVYAIACLCVCLRVVVPERACLILEKKAKKQKARVQSRAVTPEQITRGACDHA